MSKSVDGEWVEKKLRSANDTMESVQTLSLWALNHKTQCEQIVAIWLKVLKTAEPTQMIVMFYLCNEVLQTCKRKNAQAYKESFKNILKEAVSVVKEEKAVLSLQNILKVWTDRNVFDKTFIAELNRVMSRKEEEVEEETLSRSSEQHTTLKKKADSKLVSPVMKRAKLCPQLSDFNLATLCGMLKSDAKLKSRFREETARCSDFVADVDEAVAAAAGEQKSYLESNETKIKDLCKLFTDLNNHLNAKQHLVEYLEIAKQYYDGLSKDAKLVSLAYKNYSNRVSNLSKKLTERHNLLMLSEQAKQEDEEEEDDDEEEEDGEGSSTRGNNEATEESIFRTDAYNSPRVLSHQRRSGSREETNLYKDVGKSQDKIDDEDDKLFTHLFLEDPPDDDHQNSGESGDSSGRCRRQSLDARLEMMGFPGSSKSVESESKTVRRSSQGDSSATHKVAHQEQPQQEFYNSQATPTSAVAAVMAAYHTPVNRPERYVDPIAAQNSFKPHNYHLLGQQPTIQQQTVVYPQYVYIPQMSQHQISSAAPPEDDGRATPVQDEPPSPEPSSKDGYRGKSARAASNFEKDGVERRDKHSSRSDEAYRDFVKSTSEKRESSRKSTKERERDATPRKSSHKSVRKEEERRQVERSRHNEERHHDRARSHRSREKWRSDRDYHESKHSRSRHRSRDSDRESEKRVKKASSHYSSSKKLDQNSTKSKAREHSPVESYSRSISRSPTPTPGKCSKALASYLHRMQGNEMVMEGIYQAVERSDGFSEIYRLPSNADPSQYTYEEVVYLFTEEDGTTQLKQLGQGVVTTSSNTVLYSSSMQRLANSASAAASSAQVPSTFLAAGSFKSVVSAASFPPVPHVQSALPTPPQTILPLGVIQGIAQPPVIQPSVLGPAQVSVQVPPPPLPQQPVYSFVQQPPPPLPSVMPHIVTPTIPPPSLLTNQIKESVPQAPSLLGVPIVTQLQTSAASFSSSFPGISKVLPSPSQFCQGIGATALLQRRMDETSLENLSRLRGNQPQSGKSQIPTSRRACTLTTIQLTDDVGERSTPVALERSEQSVATSTENCPAMEVMPLMSITIPEPKYHVEHKAVEEVCSASIIQEELSSDNQNFSELSNKEDLPSEISEKELVAAMPEKIQEEEGQADGEVPGEGNTTGDDPLSDNGSSDLEDMQDAVTFTAPLHVAGVSSHSYSTPSGREHNSQSGLLKRHQGDAVRNFSLGSINNRIRALPPGSLIPPRIPLFPVNHIQQFQNFGRLPGTGLRLSMVPQFGAGVTLINRINLQGNPRL